MRNLRFKYLYRDSSNYKSWGDVVLRNSEGLSVISGVRKLRERFLNGELFIAAQIRVPDVFLFKDFPITQDDHCFHEFHSLEATDEQPTDEFRRSITDLVREVEIVGRKGWDIFDPLDE